MKVRGRRRCSRWLQAQGLTDLVSAHVAPLAVQLDDAAQAQNLLCSGGSDALLLDIAPPLLHYLPRSCTWREPASHAHHHHPLLQIGDASAAQSPLSFGGFGAMLRHLPRLAVGVDDALREDRLEKADLGMLQPYQPSLSAAWLFQRCVFNFCVVALRQNTEEGRPGAAAAAPAIAVGRPAVPEVCGASSCLWSHGSSQCRY